MRATRRWFAPIVIVVTCAAFPSLALGVPAPSISVSSSARQIGTHGHVKLTGSTTGALPGSVVDVFASPYPHSASMLIGTAHTSIAGTYSFSASPDRNTIYRVVLAGTSAQAQTTVLVIGTTVTKVHAITLGRAEVTIIVFHPRDLRWNGARASWSFTHGAGQGIVATDSTPTRRLSPYTTVLRSIVALPAGRFGFRVCFHAADDRALANPRRPPGCTGRGYHGRGSLPVGYPGPGLIAQAERALARREGRTAFAVIDTEGRMSGVRVHRQFITGSVVKAMLLVAYLRRLNALGQRHIDPHSASFLYPMIHVSDNGAASQTMSYVGAAGLYGVAHAAGMTDFYVPGSAPGDWGAALLSAADQARFFFEMDSLIPRQFVGYARFLLSTIAAYESWGIPAVARPRGYRVFFKGGWRPSPDIYLVNQIARLEGHHRTFAMAIMTDGDPDMGYGIGTIQSVTGALLR